MKLPAAWLIPVCGVLAASQASAWEKYGIHSVYPAAISVQINPSQISNQQLAAIKDAGFEYVRFGTRPPVSDKPQDFSELLERLRKAQLKPIITLFGGATVWVQPKRMMSATMTPLDAADNFSKFALTTLNQYADPNILWELWNEPDNPTFLKPGMLQAGLVPAIQKICSALEQQKGAVKKNIFGFGFAKLPNLQPKIPDDKLLAISLQNCLSGVSVHPYRKIPETLADDATKSRELLHKYGKGELPMIASEWGYSNFTAARDQGGQAQLVLREYLSTVFAGIPLVNIYQWQDTGPDRAAREQNYGLTDSSGQVKQALPALKHLLGKLKDTQLAGSEKVGGAYQLVLNSQPGASAKRSVHVVWSSAAHSGPGGGFSIPRNKGQRCVISEFYPQQGDKPCPEGAGSVDINAGPSPLAVTLYD